MSVPFIGSIFEFFVIIRLLSWIDPSKNPFVLSHHSILVVYKGFAVRLRGKVHGGGTRIFILESPRLPVTSTDIFHILNRAFGSTFVSVFAVGVYVLK